MQRGSIKRLNISKQPLPSRVRAEMLCRAPLAAAEVDDADKYAPQVQRRASTVEPQLFQCTTNVVATTNIASQDEVRDVCRFPTIGAGRRMMTGLK